jgi:type IV secretion system protein VirB8
MTTAAHKLPLSKKALASIADARTWEEDRMANAIASSRRGWMAAGVCAVLAVLGVSMAAVQSFRPAPAPFPVVVDRTTGETNVVTSIDAASVPPLAALDQHNAAVFVRARESYHYALLQRDYDQVARMSTPDVWAAYGAKFQGANAMHTAIAGTQEHRVTVVSVRLSRLPQGGKNGEAIVTFDKEIRSTQGQTPVTTRYVATVRYEYRPGAMKKDTDRIENPFGFVVTGYRADAELVSPAKPADALAVTAGGAS